ncbi:MAG TPA: hypothetical protein VKB80_25805 [Kofleriaceae bacterium]|nr:hypothetical protein [Kofleriaceae bacterium]
MRHRTLAILVAAAVHGAPAAADPGTTSKEKPARLFSAEDEDAADPARVVRKVEKEVALGQKGAGRLLLVTATTTDEWGCECPPFVYSPFSTAAPEKGSAFFYPVVASGPDPASFSVGSAAGSFELVGRFDRRKMTFAEWARARKAKVRLGKHAPGSFREKQAVFAVESWCFRRAGEVGEAYKEELARMTKAGVTFCK